MAAVTERLAQTKSSRSLRWTLAPYILATYFAVTAMWGFWNTDVVDTDAARHAMNGAFLYDLLRTGHISHPIDYAEEYYGHLPALSMPYHPPLFPAVEAVFYALFGVKLFTARLAIAISVAICTLLFYRLVERTMGNRVLAACATVTMCSLWTSQEVARDVMLEYPAMAFMLAALCYLRKWDNDFPMKHAIAFAVFAAAAFWTKQHAVLLAGIPPLWALMTGRWRLLLRKPALVAIALFAAAVGTYVFLASRFHNAGIHEAATSTSDLQWIASITVPAYFQWIKAGLTGVPAIFAVCAALLFLLSLGRSKSALPRLGLYWAWIVSGALVLADLGNTDYRYLFFLYPAAMAVGYAWLFSGAARMWGERSAAAVALTFALIFFVNGFWAPHEYLRGPGAAAKAVLKDGPMRILYAGETDGNFIFSARVLDPDQQVTVIPGGKLPKTTFQPKDLEGFCRQYGVGWVIVESGPIQHPWSSLRNDKLSFLKLEGSFLLESSRDRWRTGIIDVFRVEGSSSAPGGILNLPIRRLGRNITVKL
jgi:4-amino-4-deoxy-L-arabinose transferase-like glycosyltransferase